MNIAVIGSCELSLNFAKILIANEFKVSTMVALSNENSTNTEDFSLLSGIPYFEADDINSKKTITFLKELKLDYILSAWPYFISKDVLDIAKYGVIGTHPTPLPRNKGRHPLHWMIAMGINMSSLSFYKMDESIDSGNILIQEPFVVGVNINLANKNMIASGRKGLMKLMTLLKRNPEYSGTSQDENGGNYWRKRDINDITIDPRMSSSAIIRLVNSFLYPFPLAKLYFEKNSYFNITKASNIKIDDLNKDWESYEYGYIFKSTMNSFNIRVDDAVINLEIDSSNEFLENLVGKKIRPPSYYMIPVK